VARRERGGDAAARDDASVNADELASLDLYDDAVTQCPYPYLAELRQKAPVVWNETVGAFVVTRHETIRRIVRNPALFSSQFGRPQVPVPPEHQARIDAIIAEGYPRIATLLTADPPAHTRFRRLVTKAFSPTSIAALEPTIRQITHRLIDAWVGQERIDFVQSFAVPLPVEVIATALNVPDDDLGKFKHWSDAAVATIGSSATVEDHEASERAANEFQHYFAAQLERRRQQPQDDLLTHLLDARIDDDDPEVTDRRPLELGEILRILHQLLVAGNETTTSLLTDLMVTFGRRQDAWRRLREEPDAIPKAVEEGLRLSTPASAIWRISVEDTELEGVAVPAGSRLVITWMSGNRDEDVFGPDVDDFRLDRARLNEHLAFGFGIHYCVGASLARLESRIALEELTRRVESFTLSGTNDYRCSPSFFVRGILRLDLEPQLVGP
jgi:cytochrome P450